MLQTIARYMFLPLLLLIAVPAMALGCSGDQSNGSTGGMTGPATLSNASTLSSTDASSTSFNGTFSTGDGTTGTFTYTFIDPAGPTTVTGDASFVYTPDTNLFFTITTTSDAAELPIGTTFDYDTTWSTGTAGSYTSTVTEPAMAGATSSGTFTYSP